MTSQRYMASLFFFFFFDVSEFRRSLKSFIKVIKMDGFRFLACLKAMLRINTALTGLSPNLPWRSEVIMGTTSTAIRMEQKSFAVIAMSELHGISLVGPPPAAVERRFIRFLPCLWSDHLPRVFGGTNSGHIKHKSKHLRIFKTTLDRRREVIEEDGESDGAK